ncbi:MAG: hypothetical protein AAGG11_19265 [Pseudomonadota bacterium]
MPSVPALAVRALLILTSLGLAQHAAADALPEDAPAAAALPVTMPYLKVPMPPGFRVEQTELEGPVFADTLGQTLYTWPQHKHRNGYSGEAPDLPACYDEVTRVTAGLMSPYPPGIELPELESRPSCTDLWPPVLAAEDAEPVGDWTLVERRDGALQWAWGEQPLYTSVRDQQPGDTIGGSGRRFGGDSPAVRKPASPPPLVPPGFAVKRTTVGLMLTTRKNEAVYAFEADTPTTTACDAACQKRWRPLLAPRLAREQGAWRTFEPAPGVRQWVFRGKPLFAHRRDTESWSQEGADVPGWSNVFMQPAPALPPSFTVQPTMAGEVLADARGRTIYTYRCGDDSVHQLACDHPDDTQVYRLAMCGAGNPERCLTHWPYVEAGADERSVNRSWRISRINPFTGRFAAADDPTALRVWTFRDRPVYTYGGDLAPGDVHGGGTGEWRGQRNGLKAFWLRDDYMRGIL